MRVAIVGVHQLPLGRRDLRYGDEGRDVRELQTALHEAGFYFGAPDGIFGTLTAESVLMLQKAYGLKPDGIAGPAFFQKLARNPNRPGRIVHSVKKQESLAALSQRFGVRETAWGSLSGQGNPQKRIYPGMKLFLPEKLFFLWEDRVGRACGAPEGGGPTVPFSGLICPGWRLDADGGLELTGAADAGTCQTVEAAETVWEELFRSRRKWKDWAAPLRRLHSSGPQGGIVFDLRNAPGETMKEWPAFFKAWSGKTDRDGRRALAIIRVPAPENAAAGRIFWSNLILLAPFFQYFLFSPDQDWESPAACLETYRKLPQFFRQLKQTGLAAQSLWIEQVGGWVWRSEAQDGGAATLRETLLFREAQRIRAMFPKGIRDQSDAKLVAVEFLRRGVTNTLIYRDENRWFDFAKQIARSHLAGLAICGFSDLKEAGPAVIQSAFAVMPRNERSFH